jgi:hypothetical protein
MVAFWLLSGGLLFAAVALVFLRVLFAAAYFVKCLMDYVVEYVEGCAVSSWLLPGCVLVAFWLLYGCFLVGRSLLWLLCSYDCFLLSHMLWNMVRNMLRDSL